MKRPKVVRLRWLDHGDIAAGEWAPLEELRHGEVFHAETVGFIVDEDDDRIILTHTVCQGSGRGGFVVVKAAITLA